MPLALAMGSKCFKSSDYRSAFRALPVLVSRGVHGHVTAIDNMTSKWDSGLARTMMGRESHLAAQTLDKQDQLEAWFLVELIFNKQASRSDSSLFRIVDILM